MTSKELSYLEDTIKAEMQVIKKYQTYEQSVSSTNLKDLCQKAIKKHTNHYQTLLSNLKV